VRSPPGTEKRTRNARGQGDRLRGEIVDAALRLVDQAGAESVTLRAVAREAGISAPSIYDHFDGVEQILGAVRARCFGQLTDHVLAAEARLDDPVAAFEAGCDAYLRYAEERPRRYALLFRSEDPVDMSREGNVGTEAFATLVDGIKECVRGGRSSSQDPFADGVALWSGMHGYASLRSARPGFPWPEDWDTKRRLIHGLARITPPSATA
jgi:AcrR family transcriptional regulator